MAPNIEKLAEQKTLLNTQLKWWMIKDAIVHTDNGKGASRFGWFVGRSENDRDGDGRLVIHACLAGIPAWTVATLISAKRVSKTIPTNLGREITAGPAAPGLRRYFDRLGILFPEWIV